MNKIKVMVIDDSAVVRQVLSGFIDSAPGMEVIAAVADPVFALKKLETLTPDVITLDIEMPRMDGLTFLEKLMVENPLPVIICSTVTHESPETSVKALRLGAIDIIAKPGSRLRQDLLDQKKLIINAIRAASRVRMDKLKSSLVSHAKTKRLIAEKRTADAVIPRKSALMQPTSAKVIAIGTSTGGTQALEFILSRLKPDVPGMVVVQHMPEAFTEAFADRLDSISPVQVKQAENGDPIEIGKVLIAPGGRHMLVENHAGRLSVRVRHGPLVSRHRPSVDVLFRSVAQAAPKQAMGVIMTGMGGDGAAGLREMFDAGSFTVAQDEASCVIFGMPSVAIERGGVRKVCSLEQIPDLINSFSRPVEFKTYTS